MTVQCIAGSYRVQLTTNLPGPTPVLYTGTNVIFSPTGPFLLAADFTVGNTTLCPAGGTITVVITQP